MSQKCHKETHALQQMHRYSILVGWPWSMPCLMLESAVVAGPRPRYLFRRIGAVLGMPFLFVRTDAVSK
jgi:hypothetical protein